MTDANKDEYIKAAFAWRMLKSIQGQCGASVALVFAIVVIVSVATQVHRSIRGDPLIPHVLCARPRVCVCVCVCARALCVCMCVCAVVR